MTDAVAFLTSRVAGSFGVAPASEPRAPSATDASLPSFGEVLEQVSRGAVESVRQAEATSISALQGQASTLEVVQAIQSAEQALHTATAVRDKMVQAYQEVSRMAI